MEGSYKVAIIGASRGLGRSLAKLCGQDQRVSELLLVSRQNSKAELPINAQFLKSDLSKPDIEPLISDLEVFNPNRVFYLAGGGPFNLFQNSPWQAHRWAFQVTFLSAAKLLHWYMGRAEKNQNSQFILTGSSVAESKGDSKSGSYAAAKHAILGLYQSIQSEKPEIDLRLFSPGYMDTELLPQGSWPRKQSQLIWEPDQVAKIWWEWSCNAQQAGGHMSLNAFAEQPPSGSAKN